MLKGRDVQHTQMKGYLQKIPIWEGKVHPDNVNCDSLSLDDGWDGIRGNGISSSSPPGILTKREKI